MSRFPLGITLVASLAPGSAGAQDYDPGYAIEIYRGPLMVPVNIMGMGGAFTSVAEGSGAQLINPVAVANRYPYTGNHWFDWDWSFDFLGLGTGGGPIHTDFDNDGRSEASADGIIAVNFSASLNFGRLGIGVLLFGQTYNVCLDEAQNECDADTVLEYNDIIGAWSLAYNFLDGQLLAGAQIAFAGATFKVGGDQSGSPEVKKNGGLGLGLLWRPYGLPIRVGASFRNTMNPDVALREEGQSVGGRLLPERLATPWELAVGVSYRIGTRPYNLRYSFGDDILDGERADDYARGYHLLSLDLVLIGPSRRAVGVSAWLDQVDEKAGEDLSISVRAGYETEFWDDFLRGRLGTYWEPSRFAQRSGRIHGTGGLDIRLFDLIWVWRLTIAFDIAPRFSNYSLSLGFWH